MSKEKEDLINRPNHYCKFNVELESLDVIDLFSFNLGCALKYSIRYRDKGYPIMDLEKALFFAKRINNNIRKKAHAIHELKQHRSVLEIFLDKSKDIVTYETVATFIHCIDVYTFDAVIEMLEKRLENEQSKPVAVAS